MCAVVTLTLMSNPQDFEWIRNPLAAIQCQQRALPGDHVGTRPHGTKQSTKDSVTQYTVYASGCQGYSGMD